MHEDETIRDIAARITAIEYLLEHMFAWTILRDGQDGDAILDALSTTRGSTLPKGALMDASLFQAGDEAVRRHVQLLCEKLRRRLHELRDLPG